ncbi:MAG: type IV pilus secretin PilQ [Endozoicomonadaceae bacterium]|nr:type IV pilus secretin PilQ [Endozoicomonadaceae bacterium]
MSPIILQAKKTTYPPSIPQQNLAILTHIKNQSISDNASQIALQFEDHIPEWTHTYSKKKDELILSLKNSKHHLHHTYQVINKLGIQSINVTTKNKFIFLIIKLQKETSFEIITQNNTLLCKVYIDAGIQKASKDLEKSKQLPKEILHPTPQLIGFDFFVTQDGEGNLIFQSSTSEIPHQISKENKTIDITFYNKKLSNEMKNKIFNTLHFNTIIQSIEFIEKPSQVIAKIILKEQPLDVLSKKIKDQKLIVSVLKNTKQSINTYNLLKQQKDKKISLNFQDISVRAVLQILAKEANVNLVASNSVSGNITLQLNNVSWQEALDIILHQKGLDKRIENNILNIAPTEELASREKIQFENTEKLKKLAPLESEFLQINNENAETIATVLKGSGKSRILSERGSVTIVQRLNTLLITETKEQLKIIKDLIQKIDVPISQVIIEARIIEARSNIREELGVQWGKNDTTPTTDAVLSNKTLQHVVKKISDKVAIKDINVSLPASASAPSIAFGFLSSINLGLKLSALEMDDKVEIISQPQIITTNNKKATIRKGSEYAFETTSANGTNTTFKDVSLALEVTPQITADGHIVLDVHLNNNEVTGYDTKNNPITSTNEINTQLLVNNGETVVLGGIFKKKSGKTQTGIPILHRLPVLGKLFSKKVDIHEKSEVMVFITPRIIQKKSVIPHHET